MWQGQLNLCLLDTIESREDRSESLEDRGWPRDRQRLAPGLAIRVGPGAGQAEVRAGELVQGLEVLLSVSEGEQGDNSLPCVTRAAKVKWGSWGSVSNDLRADFVKYIDQIIVEIQILGQVFIIVQPSECFNTEKVSNILNLVKFDIFFCVRYKVVNVCPKI